MDKHKEELKKAMQELYDAAVKFDKVIKEEDFERFEDICDATADILNTYKLAGIVEDGIVDFE